MEETHSIEEWAPVQWTSFLIRGIVALIIGILVLMYTDFAVEVLVVLFGILVLIEGAACLVRGMGYSAGDTRSTLGLALGVIAFLIGIAALIWPWMIAGALTIIIAVLLLFLGFSDIVAAVFGHTTAGARALQLIAGALAVFLGGIFLFFPLLGAVVMVAVWLGIFGVVWGVIAIILAFCVRSAQKKAAAAA